MEIAENTNHLLLSRLANISHLIGNTQIMHLAKESKGIIAKLEFSNFSGSIKDRATLSILKNAIERNQLKEGGTIIESTSGNFGILVTLISSINSPVAASSTLHDSWSPMYSASSVATIVLRCSIKPFGIGRCHRMVPL